VVKLRFPHSGSDAEKNIADEEDDEENSPSEDVPSHVLEDYEMVSYNIHCVTSEAGEKLYLCCICGYSNKHRNKAELSLYALILI
jgi:hypothetical protein